MSSYDGKPTLKQMPLSQSPKTYLYRPTYLLDLTVDYSIFQVFTEIRKTLTGSTLFTDVAAIVSPHRRSSD